MTFPTHPGPFIGRCLVRGSIAAWVALLAGACADATRITSIDTDPMPGGVVVRYDADALMSANRRAMAMAASGDSSLLWHLRAMDGIRSPGGPRFNEEPTGSESPTFVAPTYTRATISPYDAGVLVETSYKYAYYLELNGEWSFNDESGVNRGSAPYSWAGNNSIDWSTHVRHHALEVDIRDLPRKCGLLLIARTNHRISRQENIPGYGLIQWSPASADVNTGGNGSQNPCDPNASCDPADQPPPPPATATIPLRPNLDCSPPSGGGGGGGGSSGGFWVTTTTCYGYHYYDENGNYMYSEITYCTSDSYYME